MVVVGVVVVVVVIFKGSQFSNLACTWKDQTLYQSLVFMFDRCLAYRNASLDIDA